MIGSVAGGELFSLRVCCISLVEYHSKTIALQLWGTKTRKSEAVSVDGIDNIFLADIPSLINNVVLCK
jgi:hypothetical protein